MSTTCGVFLSVVFSRWIVGVKRAGTTMSTWRTFTSECLRRTCPYSEQGESFLLRSRRCLLRYTYLSVRDTICYRYPQVLSCRPCMFSFLSINYLHTAMGGPCRVIFVIVYCICRYAHLHAVASSTRLPTINIVLDIPHNSMVDMT